MSLKNFYGKLKTSVIKNFCGGDDDLKNNFGEIGFFEKENNTKFSFFFIKKENIFFLFLYESKNLVDNIFCFYITEKLYDILKCAQYHSMFEKYKKYGKDFNFPENPKAAKRHKDNNDSFFDNVKDLVEWIFNFDYRDGLFDLFVDKDIYDETYDKNNCVEFLKISANSKNLLLNTNPFFNDIYGIQKGYLAFFFGKIGADIFSKRHFFDVLNYGVKILDISKFDNFQEYFLKNFLKNSELEEPCKVETEEIDLKNEKVTVAYNDDDKPFCFSVLNYIHSEFYKIEEKIKNGINLLKIEFEKIKKNKNDDDLSNFIMSIMNIYDLFINNKLHTSNKYGAFSLVIDYSKKVGSNDVHKEEFQIKRCNLCGKNKSLSLNNLSL